MSNINNLTQEIAKKSRDLAAAQAAGDTELADQLWDELNDLEDALEDAEAASRTGGGNWFQN